MRVVLLGANGIFGSRLAALLANIPGLNVVLAGRDTTALRALAENLPVVAATTIEVRHIDLDAPTHCAALLEAAPDVLIDTCGPFQSRDYRLPKLAIEHHFHYIDLADAPDFVVGITTLDAAARAADVLVVSGASSVPGLSSAVIDAFAGEFDALKEIDIGISPGNRTRRGLASIRSVFSGVGKPHAQFERGALRSVPGWSGLHCHHYAAPVGKRWLAYCAVPDPLLLPQRYPGLERLNFRAGVELGRMHFGLWLGAWLVRLRLLSSLTPFAEFAKRTSERWLKAGSDAGAMHVRLRGIDRQGAAHELLWQLIAEDADGPFVPAAAAATLVRLLAQGRIGVRGAQPCIGLLPLDEIRLTLAGRAIRFLHASSTQRASRPRIPT